MRTVILNWTGGENDPFTVMNAALAHHLRACGKHVEIVEFPGPDWAVRIADMIPGGIDFVLTWQGMGSGAEVDIDEKRLNFWELVKVPLICLHGDHPAHNPANHQLESRYCFHLYSDPEFADYSNRHFRRIRGASLVDMPALHREAALEWPTDDCFVIAKNIVHPIDMEAAWRQRFDEAFFDYHMAVLEVLRSRIDNENYVDVHRTVDEFLGAATIAEIKANSGPAVYHQFHSRMDNYVRNYRSVKAVAALKDFPVKIFGRGWDRIAATAGPTHRFLPGLSMAESQPLFYSRFGLVDISPARVLHDRTLRAMANRTSFLTSAVLDDLFHPAGKHARLSFRFNDQGLAEKCAEVMTDPEGHRNRAQACADEYLEKYGFRQFVHNLDVLAKSIDRFSPTSEIGPPERAAEIQQGARENF